MPAIGIHHTETSSGGWDGPANEARLKTDGSQAYYRRAYAWQDADGDPETKAAYRFIHHEVDGEGNAGPANIRACQTGIAVLNGARGGTTIPAADRRGVYNHLAAHLRDADVEPPDLREYEDSEIERRTVPLGLLEVRQAGENGEAHIVGHAALFGVLSEDLGGFRERIEPGAFARSLAGDVRALWNHDANYVLGRTTAGTLQLSEDAQGLRVEIEPPDTTWARDLLVTIRRGDVNQMSFGFRVPHGGEQWTSEDGMNVRTLTNVELFDVSPVTFPAYPQTSVAVRNKVQSLRAQALLDEWMYEEEEASERALTQLQFQRLELLEKEL